MQNLGRNLGRKSDKNVKNNDNTLQSSTAISSVEMLKGTATPEATRRLVTRRLAWLVILLLGAYVPVVT